MQVARVLMPAGAASLYIAKLTDENGESTPDCGGVCVRFG